MNFTSNAFDIMQFVYQEALRLNYNFIGSELVLLGILKLTLKNNLPPLLKNISIRCYENIMNRILGEGENYSDHLEFTPTCYKLLKEAAKELITVERLIKFMLAENSTAMAIIKELKPKRKFLKCITIYNSKNL